MKISTDLENPLSLGRDAPASRPKFFMELKTQPLCGFLVSTPVRKSCEVTGPGLRDVH